MDGEPERFLEEVALTYDGDECLTWPFAKHNQGYGVLYRKAVHRIICARVNGPPPTPKHEAAHSCGNGHLACVTPKHLSWKTRFENKADEVLHETRNRGERHGLSKLTADQVREIRKLDGAIPTKAIAARYGVSPQQIRNIVTLKGWHYPDA